MDSTLQANWQKAHQLNTNLSFAGSVRDVINALDVALGDNFTAEYIRKRAVEAGYEKDITGKKIRYDKKVFSQENIDLVKFGHDIFNVRVEPGKSLNKSEQAYLLKTALVDVALNKVFTADTPDFTRLKLDTVNLIIGVVDNSVLAQDSSKETQQQLAHQHVNIAAKFGLREAMIKALYRDDSHIKGVITQTANQNEKLDVIKEEIGRRKAELTVEKQELDANKERVGKFQAALDNLENDLKKRRDILLEKALESTARLNGEVDSIIGSIQAAAINRIKTKYADIRKNGGDVAQKFAEQIFDKFYDLEEYIKVMPRQTLTFEYRDKYNNDLTKNIKLFSSYDSTAIFLMKLNSEHAEGILPKKDIYIQNIKNIILSSVSDNQVPYRRGRETINENHKGHVDADTLYINYELLGWLKDTRTTSVNYDAAKLLSKKLEKIGELYKEGAKQHLNTLVTEAKGIYESRQ